MSNEIEPVQVDIVIENPRLVRDAFYNLCFITENDEAPRTLEVKSLSDLLSNGYNREDLAYNFCVGVFAQQSMPSIFIRAKRSIESYEDAYLADSNDDYYYLVLQTKNITEINNFNQFLISTGDLKIQFYSSNKNNIMEAIESKILVNYYQDYELDDEPVPVNNLDHYLNVAYGGDTGDTIPSDFSYINIASLPTTSVFGDFAYDVNIAACLKIQVGDSTPFISNFVTGRYNLKNRGATPEQSAINFLFQKIASGIEFNPWGYMESMKSNPRIQYAGLWATNFGEGSLGKENKVVLVALNEFYIRLAVRDYILDVSDSELKEVPFDELQAFINFNLNTGSYTEIKIIDNPSTLTFSRCTQTEIDNLFEGNHQPHVDMFDSIKSLLPNEDSEINSNGLASAIYYAERDVIEFKTKYILEVTERDD